MIDAHGPGRRVPRHRSRRGGHRPSTGRIVSRAALAALVVGIVATTTACDPPRCQQPYPAAGFRYVPRQPGQGWPAEGTVRSFLGFDTDGDGVEDTVEPADASRVPAVTVHRAGGDLVLTGHPLLSIGVSPTARPVPSTFGDVDGDGLSEVVVTTYDAAGAVAGAYVVPGSTPAGTHDPAVVGTGIPAGGRVVAAGDVDGDGTDDLAFGSGEESLVVGGDQVAAAGPGRELDPDNTHAEWVLGGPAGAVALTPEVSALVTVTGSREGTDVMLWARGSDLRFTTVGTEIPGFDGAFESTQVRLIDGDDGHPWLVASDGRRNLGVEWAWNLDDLCAGAPEPAQG